MDDARLKAIEALLQRRTAENTVSRKAAREWILRDGVHSAEGWLVRDPSDEKAPAKKRA